MRRAQTTEQIVNALRLTLQHLEQESILTPNDPALAKLKAALLQRLAEKAAQLPAGPVIVVLPATQV
jgi:hypothetical protein